MHARWRNGFLLATGVFFGAVAAPGLAHGQCADLAIGAIRDDETGVQAGGVNILPGFLAGLGATGNQLWNQNSTGIPGIAETEDWFGFKLAAGDFDGDLAADLAVSAVWETIGDQAGAGAVNIIYGTSEGLAGDRAQLWHQNVSGIPDVAETEDFFGTALTVGDFDSDGYDDLVVAAGRDDIGDQDEAGFVHILFGTATGLTAAGTEVWSQDTTGIQGIAEANDRFGSSLAVGDFDGSGTDDLVIGVSREDLDGPVRVNAGAVNVIYSDGSGLTITGDDLWTQDIVHAPGSSEAADYFGTAVAAGNFDGDAYDDLAIGAPFEDISGIANAGAVSVLYGSATGLLSTDSDYWTQAILGDDLGSDQFGQVLAAGDFNRDGYDDLAVASTAENLEDPDGIDPTIVKGGAVHVLYGSASGLRSTGAIMFSRALEPVDGTPEAYDAFGHSLAVGDFNCDRVDDLAIGVHWAAVDTVTRSGSVNVIYGIPLLGVFPIGDQLWSQNSPGVLGVARDGDELGAAVAVIPALRTVFVDDFELGSTFRWSDTVGDR